MIRRSGFLGLVLTAFLVLNGCLSLPPHAGGFGYGSYTYPSPDFQITANQSLENQRTGSACIVGEMLIPFLYYNWRGDASLQAAAANGGITQISTVSYQFRRPLIGNLQICTLVSGK
ncbi:MAG: hypothetical protein KDK39_03460 [Leptospiraceae bacterium]|nr:hypothetical protein [Leptospiraceae bacterium]